MRSDLSIRTRLAGALLLTTLMVLVSGAMPAFATSFAVNTSADSAPGALGCVGAGQCTLREAIEEADGITGGATIYLPALSGGAHYVLTNGELSLGSTVVSANNPVTLAGANADGSPSLAGDPVHTVIDAGSPATPTTSSRVFSVCSVSAGSDVSITGVTITGGNVSGPGGGIYLADSCGSLDLTNVIVDANQAQGNPIFVGGGGIYVGSAVLTVHNSKFSSNDTVGSGTYGGGAIDIAGSPGATPVVTVDQSTFSDNHAGPCCVTDGSNGIGGAIVQEDGTLTLTNSLVTGNTAGAGSGIMDSLGSQAHTTVLTNDTFTANTTTSSSELYAAAVLLDPPNGNNGAVGFHTDLLNVTIANNIGAGAGSGLANFCFSPGSGCPASDAGISVKNTIVSGNSPSNCSSNRQIGAAADAGHNLEDTNTCGFTAGSPKFDQASTNPLLGALSNNGGPTQTLALQAGSPAEGAGDNSGCPATDQRGLLRPATPSDPCDVGAFELTPGVPVFITSPSDGATTSTTPSFSGTASNTGGDVGLTLTDSNGHSTGYSSAGDLNHTTGAFGPIVFGASTALSPGSYTARADQVQNSLDIQSALIHFTVATPPPPPPPPPPPDTTAPVVQITSPTPDQQVAAGQRVPPLFTCTDEAGGSGIAVPGGCQGTIIAPPGSQAALDFPNGRTGGSGTNPNNSLTVLLGPGVWSLVVIATDRAGNQGSALVHYIVGDSGTSVLSPAANSALAAVAANEHVGQVLANGGITLKFTALTPSLWIAQSTVIAGGAGNVISGGAGNVISGGAGNVISGGAGNVTVIPDPLIAATILAANTANVISGGAGNVISGGAGNVIAGGAFNRAISAAKRHAPAKPKPVLLMAGSHAFDRPGSASVKLGLTKSGRAILKKYAALVRRLRKAHKRVPKSTLAITFIVAPRDGNSRKSPAVYVTRKIRLMP